MDESFAGRRVTVMGLGTFGAGIAATQFFCRSGASVTVTDLRSETELADSLAQLDGLTSLRFQLGAHDERDFTQAELVVASPSVKPGNRFVALAASRGVPVTSEMRLFWQRCRAPIVGVTGSNGKSTTATLIRDVLQADGRKVWLGGNIGRSLLPCVEQIAPTDWVVLELSSFQLHDLDVDRRSPHVAVVTNFTANHLDWHKTIEGYATAKQTIFRWQTSHDVAVRRLSSIEANWPTVARNIWCGSLGQRDADAMLDEHARNLSFVDESTSIVLDECPGLAGPHLRSAALLASATGRSLNVSPTAIATAFQRFTGLPHRLQVVSNAGELQFVDDSASTTPESTIAALETTGRPTVLIVGGAEKGSDLGDLADAIVRRTRAVIVIGDVRKALVAAVRERLPRQPGLAEPTRCSTKDQSAISLCADAVMTADTLDEAVAAAIGQSAAGDAILFSPGFASGSMFRNFADRGLAFVDLVGRMQGI